MDLLTEALFTVLGAGIITVIAYGWIDLYTIDAPKKKEESRFDGIQVLFPQNWTPPEEVGPTQEKFGMEGWRKL